ncbi:hypothetical protein PoB_004752500 [Plakobranchus ocellatus]|uniref:Uncharacterized protein n=1 Tax=Plakobranchus ocellatus TaxID=259542 RepID=A0AAV4BNH6_9GAST|nr:hypothetical protein PoB_004752500 [Plakobranchus ocellatus]
MHGRLKETEAEIEISCFCIQPVHNKVISGYRSLRQVRAPFRSWNSPVKSPCKSQGNIDSQENNDDDNDNDDDVDNDDDDDDGDDDVETIIGNAVMETTPNELQ